MKTKIILLLFITNLQILSAQYIKNDCDKLLLNSKELEKCINDSVYAGDFEPRINYITKLTTSVFPKYRIQRKNLHVESAIKTELDQLKKIYDSVASHKIDVYQKDNLKNGFYVSPKSYLSTTIALQSFNLYPDSYAILLNTIHTFLHPKTSEEDLRFYGNLIDKIFNKIPAAQKSEIIAVISQMRKEKRDIQINTYMELFQGGELQKNDRDKYDVIDFLLWTS